MVPFTVPDSQTVSVNVSWNPSYSGGYDQQFSIHYRKKGSGSDFTKVVIGLLPENMHTVQQLSPNTEYEFMMQASNRRGNSPTSPLAQVTTSGNKEIAFLLLIRTVIKRGGGGTLPSIRPFCTFLSRHCTTTTSKCLISRFVEDGNTRQQLSFSFPEI